LKSEITEMGWERNVIMFPSLELEISFSNKVSVAGYPCQLFSYAKVIGSPAWDVVIILQLLHWLSNTVCVSNFLTARVDCWSHVTAV
jgi:hypothetical protein